MVVVNNSYEAARERKDALCQDLSPSTVYLTKLLDTSDSQQNPKDTPVYISVTSSSSAGDLSAELAISMTQ